MGDGRTGKKSVDINSQRKEDIKRQKKYEGKQRNSKNNAAKKKNYFFLT